MYIKINNEKITAEELAKRLGLSAPITSLSLCVNIPAGELQVNTFDTEWSDCPGIDTFVKLKDGTSIMVARTEQMQNLKPVTWLYNRTDVYLAYLRHDVRSDDEFDKEPKDPVLVVGGDIDFDVQLYRENQYVVDNGMLPEDMMPTEDEI